MNRKIRIALLLFIFLSLAGLAALVTVHYRTKNSLKVTFAEDEKAEVKIDRIHYSGTKDGRIEWELDADSAERSKTEDLTVFENVRVNFYSKDDKRYTLTAKEGRFREAAGEITAVGDVEMDSEEGYRIKSESVTYFLKEKRIASDEFVSMTSEGIDLSGTGLEFEVEKGTVVLRKEVKAVFKDSEIKVFN